MYQVWAPSDIYLYCPKRLCNRTQKQLSRVFLRMCSNSHNGYDIATFPQNSRTDKKNTNSSEKHSYAHAGDLVSQDRFFPTPHMCRIKILTTHRARNAHTTRTFRFTARVRSCVLQFRCGFVFMSPAARLSYYRLVSLAPHSRTLSPENARNYTTDMCEASDVCAMRVRVCVCAYVSRDNIVVDRRCRRCCGSRRRRRRHRARTTSRAASNLPTILGIHNPFQWNSFFRRTRIRTPSFARLAEGGSFGGVFALKKNKPTSNLRIVAVVAAAAVVEG